MAWQVFRVVLVLALVLAAAVVATPPGRLPLALRGLHKIMRRDRGLPEAAPGKSASAARKTIAFILVLLAAAAAMI